jgi:hypothetical protein
MNQLIQARIATIYHYAPLHYLPFIARSRSLKSKPILAKEGFGDGHFRSMSKRQDISRGFAKYVHLTTHPAPPILIAKLKAGFPHFRLSIPSTALDDISFDLCRFNVAMTRRLRRAGKPGFPESPTNGRYYDDAVIPVARTVADQSAMLGFHSRMASMIEVLVPERLALPGGVAIETFSKEDFSQAKKLLQALVIAEPPGEYKPDHNYVDSVASFVSHALADPRWLGDGLEFDRLR